ncbi:head-tail adaptor protein [Sansalvadorimonas verongulae]|uniref:head-tail adaptor protein n=1 Tax=Sansalvadorimonas verongulae TaxID=2172824 RepID=UPI0012BB6C55|nr:head-tail adaptor protein [Sansalvadorimonas verongulae]MTI13124.1 head-tail adaptor protein [Sansalvadorimonas verongulae]
MTPGHLKHRILLQHLTDGGDEFTDDAQVYTDFGKRWAGFRPVSSKEIEAGSGEVMNTDVVFTLRSDRSLAGLDNTWRIQHTVQHQLHTFEVTGVLPVEDSRWLKVSARRLHE